MRFNFNLVPRDISAFKMAGGRGEKSTLLVESVIKFDQIN